MHNLFLSLILFSTGVSASGFDCTSKLLKDESAKTEIIEETKLMINWTLFSYSVNQGFKLKSKYFDNGGANPDVAKTHMRIERDKTNPEDLRTFIVTEAERSDGHKLQIQFSEKFMIESSNDGIGMVCAFTQLYSNIGDPLIFDVTYGKPELIGPMLVPSQQNKFRF